MVAVDRTIIADCVLGAYNHISACRFLRDSHAYLVGSNIAVVVGNLDIDRHGAGFVRDKREGVVLHLAFCKGRSLAFAHDTVVSVEFHSVTAFGLCSAVEQRYGSRVAAVYLTALRDVDILEAEARSSIESYVLDQRSAVERHFALFSEVAILSHGHGVGQLVLANGDRVFAVGVGCAAVFHDARNEFHGSVGNSIASRSDRTADC